MPGPSSSTTSSTAPSWPMADRSIRPPAGVYRIAFSTRFLTSATRLASPTASAASVSSVTPRSRPLAPASGRKILDHISEDAPNGYGAPSAGRSGLRPGKRQHLLQEAPAPVDPRPQRGQSRPGFRGQVHLRKRLRLEAERCHGRAQLMRRVGNEPPLRLHGLLDAVEQPVDGEDERSNLGGQGLVCHRVQLGLTPAVHLFRDAPQRLEGLAHHVGDGQQQDGDEGSGFGRGCAAPPRAGSDPAVRSLAPPRFRSPELSVLTYTR